MPTRYFEMVIKWLTRYFARKKYAKKQLKSCLEKIITDWEEPKVGISVRREKLRNSGITLKEVVENHEEYLPGDDVREALDIAREIKEVSRLNVSAHVANKPHDEQPAQIFKKRGDTVVEQVKELIKRL